MPLGRRYLLCSFAFIGSAMLAAISVGAIYGDYSGGVGAIAFITIYGIGYWILGTVVLAAAILVGRMFRLAIRRSFPRA